MATGRFIRGQKHHFLSLHHAQNVILFLGAVGALVVTRVNGFAALQPLSQRDATPLRAHHQFNGGYDASRAGISWNPMQASEFVIWHSGSADAAGRQLQQLIQHWTGTDVGEFLTRLYLGEADRVESKLTFESRNVRTPQWKGLDEDGRKALRELLQVCLPPRVLEAAEIARFAESFLLKEHTWPASAIGDKDTNKAKLEKDSFATLGHTAAIAKLIGELRLERHGEFTADDVLEMVLLPEMDMQDSKLLKMHDFFFHVGIRLTPMEKIDIVQGMAKGGWGPANIAKFVSNIEEIPEHEKPRPTKSSPSTTTTFLPFPSKQVTTSGSLTTSDSADGTENTQEMKQSVPFYFGATQEYFSAATSSSNGVSNGYKQTP